MSSTAEISVWVDGDETRAVNDHDGWMDVSFQTDPEPRFSLSPDGCVRARNLAADALIDTGAVSVRPTGQLKFGLAASDLVFRQRLRGAAERPGRPHRMILQTNDGDWRTADVWAWGCRPDLFLVFRGATASVESALEAVASAFHLTRTESKILNELCQGECPKSVARNHRASEHTVRAHLRSIYAKMGTPGLTQTVKVAARLLG